MLRSFPPGARGVASRRAGGARLALTLMLTASLVSAVFVGPSSSASFAAADENKPHKKLHHAKNRLDRNIDKKHEDLDEISNRLLKAQERVSGAWGDLDAAKSKLADLKDQVHAAAVRDQQMQELLEEAILKLQNARFDLYQSGQDVDEQRAQLASYAVSSYQTGGDTVMNIGVAFDAQSPLEALDGLQASRAVLDKQAVSLQRFEATKVLLKLTEERVEQTKNEVADKRAEAAEALQTKIDLKEQAQEAKAEVRRQLKTYRAAKLEIKEAKEREKRHLHKMEKERQRVERNLLKIAERRAKKYARYLAHHRATHHTFKDGGFLSYPVANTYITSPYGMRLHPILHIWKLHDGTDFHADCGTPVYAAATGRVIAEYYNAGYGNRIIVDHGFVKGVSLQTSYNHLTTFVAPPGHIVQRGELIAYSGTTGYSTGCHLHFMVYVNGNTVNPVNWL